MRCFTSASASQRHNTLTEEGISFSRCPSVRDYILKVTRCLLENRLWEFRQIYNLGAVVDKDGLYVRFRGQKIKGQSYDQTIVRMYFGEF